jgi:hypothetical protein
MMEITSYKADLAAAWNQFVARSRQGTFLFDRRFMDYHADRFTDASLMVCRKGRLWALLPANRDGDTLYTHQGLTYGGLVTAADAVAGEVCDAFVTLNRYLREQGVRRVVYKPVPHIYHRQPAEEDIFALSLRCQARLVERDASAVIALDRPMRFAESRRSGLRKARAEGLTVVESDDVDAFWAILSANLADKYGARPVHTVAEMKLLKGRFPQQIRLYLVCDARRQPLGGTVLFLFDRVVHTQYISASPEGKQMGALDLLFHHLINETNWSQPYFDFGTSARAEGNELNEPLIFQKHGFGGRTVCYDWYEYEP